MSTNKQALREVVEKAKELGAISRYTKAAVARLEFKENVTPDVVLALLDELEAAERRNAELKSDIKSANDRYENRTPTQWAYDQACSAIEKHRLRAEAAEKRIAELSDSHSKLRETMAAIHNTIKQDGFATPLAVIMQNAKRAHEESAAAGITVKGE